jgi:hypothetical protein
MSLPPVVTLSIWAVYFEPQALLEKLGLSLLPLTS